MILKHSETGRLYKIAAGSILSKHNYTKMNITGSFLTLKAVDNDEEVLYNWKYWAPNDYEQTEGELNDDNGQGHDGNSGGSGVSVASAGAGDGSDAGTDGVSAVGDSTGSGGE